MPKVLIIEDDSELAEKVRTWLQTENCEVDVATNGKDGEQYLSGFRYDIVLLDWQLPDIQGLDILKKYRASGGKTPIVFLTGKTEIEHKLLGLDSGVDDYITKPFDLRELSARIRTILRRPTDLLQSELKIKDAVLLVESKTLHFTTEEKLSLSSRECAVLEYLMRHPDRTFSAKALLEAVWPSDSASTEDAVRACMRLLRSKLAKLGREDLIKTVLGSGYVIES